VTRYVSLHIAGRRSEGAPLLTPAKLADWCRRFTPLAAPDAPDGAMLDITGAAHLFGGEAALLDEIEARLARVGWAARCALAPSPEGAWALARFSRARIVPETIDDKGLVRLYGPLPVAALRLTDETVYALSQAGLKRIDDILHRPRAPITARYGAAVFARLDALLLRAKSPISPRFEAPAYVVERRFAEPLVRREDIEGVLALLAADLCRLLERHGEGARQMEVSLFRIDNAVHRISAAASRPLRDAKAMSRLFAERIAAASEARVDDPLDAGFGFDLIRLAAMEVETLEARQVKALAAQSGPGSPRSMDRLEDDLDASVPLSRLRERVGVRATPQQLSPNQSPGPHPVPLPQTGEGPRTIVALDPARPPIPHAGEGARTQMRDDDDIADLIDRLGARLGLRRVTRLVPQATHIPEQAMLAMPAAQWRGNAAPAWDGPFAVAQPTRPLRIFEKPEPVEALAQVPDGPPLRFRWRRVMHEVAAIEGPERIAPEWWKAEHSPLTRDYFRVEDREGRRFWMYREGLYGSESQRPRWFMHGLFA
jgi:protein ImuB